VLFAKLLWLALERAAPREQPGAPRGCGTQSMQPRWQAPCSGARLLLATLAQDGRLQPRMGRPARCHCKMTRFCTACLLLQALPPRGWHTPPHTYLSHGCSSRGPAPQDASSAFASDSFWIMWTRLKPSWVLGGCGRRRWLMRGRGRGSERAREKCRACFGRAPDVMRRRAVPALHYSLAAWQDFCVHFMPEACS
jgi:hypothetical protein